MLAVEDLINIAIIGKSVGDEGFVQIKSQTDFPNHFLNLKEVFLLFPNKRIELSEVEQVKYKKNKVFIKFINVHNKSQAGRLYKAKIMIEEKDLYPLSDGKYYQFQLIGLKAVNENNEYIGEVIDYLEDKMYDFLLIKTESKEVMIPFIDRFIHKVDIENKTIFLSNVDEIIKIC